MMEKSLCSFMLLLSFVITMSSCSCNHTTKSDEVTDSLSVLITDIRKTAKLYTSEYKVHKIITHDDQLSLQGSFLGQEFSIDIPAGERKIAIPLDATLKGYIDFGEFTEDNVRRSGKKIEIILPDPQVALTSTTIDHDAVKNHVALLRSNFSDKELSSYEAQGRESILRSIPLLGIEERTRQSATRILVPMLTRLGYAEPDITISFRTTFTPDSMRVSDLTAGGK